MALPDAMHSDDGDDDHSDSGITSDGDGDESDDDYDD